MSHGRQAHKTAGLLRSKDLRHKDKYTHKKNIAYEKGGANTRKTEGDTRCDHEEKEHKKVSQKQKNVARTIIIT